MQDKNKKPLKAAIGVMVAASVKWGEIGVNTRNKLANPGLPNFHL